MQAFIRGIPKAELHLHIEGTLEPEMMFELAQKHAIKLAYDSVEAVRAAYQFDDLQSFLDLYYAGAEVLRDEADFHALTLAYVRRAHEDGVVHVEIFFDPQTHTSRGIAFATVLTGIHRALEDAQRMFGVTYRIILCFLRHLSADDAMATLDAALPYRHLITAVGLDSAERDNPPAKFKEVFNAARAVGFLTVAHAGEEGPPAYIYEALDLLHVSRIDHGVRCIEDPELVARLVREQMPLTVCPLSNVKLKVFAAMDAHSLKHMLDLGLCVTVNSDDPAYFGGYVAANYASAQRSLHLTERDIATLARNSITASFLAPADKKKWLMAIDAFVAQQ